MAYKVFSNGDALTGGELNTYLMNQSVMVFATATARDAALTTPTEGMVVWLEDSNKYVYYTGSAWADLIPASTAPSGNAIINGAFDIWQRGTSKTAGVFTYVSDRWGTVATHSGGTVTYTQETFTPGSSPIVGIPNYLRMTAASPTGGSANNLYQKIENVNTFAGSTVTISFYAKADATRNIVILPYQDFGSGGSSAVLVTSSTVAATTSWQRFSYTVAIPAVTGKTIGTGSSFAIELQLPANTSATIDIAGVQVESGSSATTFKRNASNIQGELAACQRYYYQSWGSNATPSADGGNFFGVSTGSTEVYSGQTFPVSMRVAPTITLYDDTNTAGTMTQPGVANGLSATAASIGTNGFRNVTGSGYTSQRASVARFKASAEL